jgi:hypothetical protein
MQGGLKKGRSRGEVTSLDITGGVVAACWRFRSLSVSR